MYIQLISLHGLIRASNIEMGRDADTGGQVRYVLELAQNLAALPEVEGVDLFTRRIKDKRVSSDYSEPIEELGPNCRLIRLPCGPGRYLRKERLWPYVDEFVDAMITFTRREGRSPTLVHGHYADAGYIAKEVASVFDVPFVFTGHSLGKPKLAYLMDEGWTREDADKELAMDRRIQVEQDCLSVADLVITSTRHERDQQYADYFKEEDLNFRVIPPGTDLDRFFPYYDYEMSSNGIDEQFKQARMRMRRELNRFHFAPDKPMILALCRPDRRKNINALISAYGESKELQAIANLAVFAGIRDDIESMPENEQKVLTDMLMAMDRYDLYGKMAIPKNHSSEFDVPELYRLAASDRGIFVNSAFIELFGLTSIESSATGLPFVATQEGGPQDIAENCKSGIAVDVTDSKALTDAMLTLLTDHEKWDECSSNGVNLVRKLYSWETHCRHYLEAIREIVSSPSRTPSAVGKPAVGPRMINVERMLITDIDNTLLGDDQALAQLKQVLKDNRSRIGFGVASGRALELIDDVLEKHGIHDIDVIISSVGAEMYYGPDRVPVKGWGAHLRSRWKPDRVHAALDGLPFLHLQPESHSQREFKISYSLDDALEPKEALPLIRDALSQTGVAHSLIFSHGRFLDILPHRASKGKAIRYLSSKWNIPLTNIATAGDSGNDMDMLTGETAGIVVGNYDPELEKLRESKSSRVYFAQAHCAGGILEGLEHYGFIGSPSATLRAVGA
ncbi:HAD-IIB family hydrolase [Blastopirellula marina]|uniref:sucrose-phosphate synthase n=1 Tax=Blastopirellula marina DSM 3645 TaxID=314230 RepID=A3ZU36_9BACT|nr:HAD-IIB family hydrolase [Blastopirellula marina]EAQ80100.1 sucrose phosphate synthase [Blastopirellula marina DSM 3645]